MSKRRCSYCTDGRDPADLVQIYSAGKLRVRCYVEPQAGDQAPEIVVAEYIDFDTFPIRESSTEIRYCPMCGRDLREGA